MVIFYKLTCLSVSDFAQDPSVIQCHKRRRNCVSKAITPSNIVKYIFSDLLYNIKMVPKYVADNVYQNQMRTAEIIWQF